MDESHVVLVSMMLYAPSFEKYHCDSGMEIGINIASLLKILKCANNDDAFTMRAQDGVDFVTLQFVTKKGVVTDFDLNLVNVDYAELAIPVHKTMIHDYVTVFYYINRTLFLISGDRVWMRRQNASYGFVSHHS